MLGVDPLAYKRSILEVFDYSGEWIDPVFFSDPVMPAMKELEMR
jgi:hypothetical protein